jgi:hypothetical protein
LTIAEARMAVQYLERAEGWAGGVDEEIVADMMLIHRRLLDKIDIMSTSRHQELPRSAA